MIYLLFGFPEIVREDDTDIQRIDHRGFLNVQIIDFLGLQALDLVAGAFFGRFLIAMIGLLVAWRQGGFSLGDFREATAHDAREQYREYQHEY